MTSLVLIAPNFSGPFASAFWDLFRRRCIVSSRPASDDPGKQRAVLRSLVKGGAAITKAIVCVSMRPDTETLTLFRSLNIPVVLIDEHANRTASVSCDNLQGGYLAGRHLIEHGHHRIALIVGRLNRPGSANADARKAGLEQALREDHATLLSIDTYQVDDYSTADGIEWHAHRPPTITAVFVAAGDTCASGVLRAASDRGVSVPKDLAVVGYDDAPISQQTKPHLTTIRQPIREMSEVAYRMAILEPSRTLARPERVVLAPTLIRRDTT